jgi:putative ABC transport system permease protein
MSLWSRLGNAFRARHVSDDVDEELASHIEEAIERGRDPDDVRRAFGSTLRHREASLDHRVAGWLTALAADVAFGWRHIRKNRVTSAAAIVSLALAIGACTTAFRLIDAMLLRPLPIAGPERLHVLVRSGIGPDGRQRIGEGTEYPLFVEWRAAVQGQAEVLAVSFASREDVTYGGDDEMEKAYRQYVSGWMFREFGLRPALGRLLDDADDATPKAHRVAVLAHHYWTSRFAADPTIVGRTFRQGNDLYEIVGVVQEGFTGTEPGTMTDIFVPTMMHDGVERADWSWFRTLVLIDPGMDTEAIRHRLAATFQAFQEERARGIRHWSDSERHNFLSQDLVLEPAAAGISNLQRDHRQALVTLGLLVLLVLLIACANVANLMTAQGAARAREMALRVSLGAGRWRLVQLVLAESAWVAGLATGLGALFAWWSAPAVVAMIGSAENPARLALATDWRVVLFAIGLAVCVTGLFGLAPAIHASAVRPIEAMKASAPRARRRAMHVLVAAQVAFCFVVLLLAGVFIASFDRLANQPVGFSAERVLTLETVARERQPIVLWEQVASHIRAVPGVEAVGISGFPLLSGNGWNGAVDVDGRPRVDGLAYFLNVSPEWRQAMQIRLIAGRDLRSTDATPGAALVNETFVRTYFGGENPIGRTFVKPEGSGTRARFEVVGIVNDARYRNMREPITATAYVPLVTRSADGALVTRPNASFIVRTTTADPLTLAGVLRQEVRRARSEFRVSTVRTQQALIERHLVRERLLATLAVFFAAVALVLAGVGLYGVLHYTVLQRRREFGIRLALGASAAHIARRVTAEVFTMVAVGALLGAGLGLASERYVETLFYEVAATDPSMLALPSLTIAAAAVLAALPPILRAARIDPMAMLRSD